MTNPVRLPLVLLNDAVVLPGMVVPIELDEPAQAAVDAAQLPRVTRRPAPTARRGCCVAPRLPDRYASYGVVATIEQVGRLAGGAPAAVLRPAGARASAPACPVPAPRSGCEAELVDDEPVTDRARRSPPSTSRW